MADKNIEDLTPKPDHCHHDHHDHHHDHHCDHHCDHHHHHVHNQLLDYYPLGPWFWEHPHHHCHHDWPYEEHHWHHHEHPNYHEHLMPPIPHEHPYGFPCATEHCLPHKDPHFLDKDNFLKEFKSEEDKMKAREALGINPLTYNPYELVNVRDFDNFHFRGYLSYDAQDRPLNMWTKVATIIGAGILNIAFIYSNGKIKDGIKSYETKVYTDTIHAEDDGKIYVEKEDEPIKVIGNDIYVKDASCYAEGYIQPILKIGDLKVHIYENPVAHCHPHILQEEGHDCCKHAPYRIEGTKLGLTQLWQGTAGKKAASAIKQKTAITNLFDDDGIAKLTFLEGADLTSFLDAIFKI